MRLNNLSLLVLFHALLGFHTSSAAPMNPFEDSSLREHGTSLPHPQQVGTWVSRGPSPLSKHHRAKTGSSVSYYGHADKDVGADDGYHPTGSNAFWGDQSSFSNLVGGSGGSSGSYDLGSHFGTGMEVESVPEPVDEDLQGVVYFQGYERPSLEELMGRYEKYNTYPWQRALKLFELERIYRQFGAYWPPMSPSTFSNTWEHVNLALHRNPEAAQLVVQGDVDIIRQVAINARPEQMRKGRVGTPRTPIVMDSFLKSHRRKGKGPIRAAIVEEPILDKEGDIIPSWAPIDWTKETRNKFLDILKLVWRSSKETIESRLTLYGPEPVAQYGPIILTGSPNEVTEAGKLLSRFQDGETHKGVKTGASNSSLEYPTWAPLYLTKDRRVRFLKKLVDFWQVDEARIVDFLDGIGPAVVSKYAQRILSRSPLESMEAVAELAAEGENQDEQVGSSGDAEPLKSSNWAPSGLSEDQLKKLVKRLKVFWKVNSEKAVISHLQALGQEVVTVAANEILSGRQKIAETGARKLYRMAMRNFHEGNRENITDPYQIQQSSYDEQHAHQNPYGDHYAQQYGHQYGAQVEQQYDHQFHSSTPDNFEELMLAHHQYTDRHGS